MNKTVSRGQFATRLGVLAAAAGSAVGLGNIWRFPYEAGQHGGSVFIFCYLLFTFALGVPLICAEFLMGRGTRSNVFGAYRKLSPRGKWYLAGYLGVIGALLIPGFYAVVAGWTVEYFVQSSVGALDLGSTPAYHTHFMEFASGNWRPLIWVVIFIAINYFVLVRGVRGIEKVCNLLMPVLFVILVVFAINSLNMDKAREGLTFLFNPDFSKFDSSTMLAALGQSFFSLSLGIGCLTTYGSYIQDNTPLPRMAVTTASFDSVVAILAAIVIFPAVITFGGSMEAGPTLVFEILPDIFHRLPGGPLWSAMFFFLLIVASLTSTISMHEIVIAFLTEEWGISRKKATAINCGAVLVLATISTLSFGLLSGWTIFGMTFFDLLNYITSNVIMPVGGLILSVFVGWVVKKKFACSQLCQGSRHSRFAVNAIIFSLRYVAPGAIILVLLNAIGII